MADSHVPPADSSIDRLHDELFDERPGKPGTRYERLTSLVVKILDRHATVVHDRDVRATAPRRSVHQIDVVVDRLGSQRPERLLIECRHHGRRIVKKDVQAHHAAALQIGAHPVLVTTVGYQTGAKTYAEDEGITLLVLRRFEDSDRENRLMELAMDVRLTFRVGPNATLHLDEPELRRLAAERLKPPFEVADAMLQWENVEVDVAGERRALLDLLRELGADEEVGRRRIQLPEPLLVPYFGEPVRTLAITWKTEAVPVMQRIVAGRDLGPPGLLVLDAVGADLNRAIFRRHLEQLAISQDGTVVDRANLWHHEEAARRAAREEPPRSA